MARILLAEDDATLRAFLARALERAGHGVYDVGDGAEALAAARAAPFDVLLADVVMPGLDGFQLAAKARAVRPGIEVIFITGFAAVTLRARELQIRGARVLSKPFHLRDLVNQVDAVLKARMDAM